MKIWDILNWYEYSGVTDICNDVSCNRLNENLSSVSQETPFQEKSVLVNQENILEQRLLSILKEASSLRDLQKSLSDFKDFSLCKTATHTLLGTGITNSPSVMIITENPNSEEDKTGLFFQGESGKLLNRMLNSISLNTENAYIAFSCPWRPAGDRPLTSFELFLSSLILHRQITLIKPKTLFVLGNLGLSCLFKEESLLKTIGKWLSFKEGSEIPTLVSFSPSFLLNNPKYREAVWKNLLSLKDYLSQIP